MPKGWRLVPGVASELAPLGSPFSDPRFTAGLERLDQGWITHRVGTVADDGTRAAITVTRRQSEAVSIPHGYGGIVADRSLEEGEVSAILDLVAEDVGARVVLSRYMPLPVDGRPEHAGGAVFASTQVVPIDLGAENEEGGVAKKARQALRQAKRAGVVVMPSADPTNFLELYEAASRGFGVVYPVDLLKELAASGLGRIYDATVGGETVSSAFVLTGGLEWMYWLAAQNDHGRKVQAGYTVVARVLSDARSSGIRFVNLGASEGLPGVAKFKRRMGGIDFPMLEHRRIGSRLSFVRSRLSRRAS